MDSGKKICLITHGHLCHTPRLVKEASALEASGYQICIIAGQFYKWAIPFDVAILEQHPRWSFDSIRWTDENVFYKQLRYFRAIRHRYYQKINRLSLRRFYLEESCGRIYPELLKKALSRSADLYIGHNLAVLPVVAKAAQKQGVPFGFDFEDAYFVEFANDFSQADPIITLIEKKYAPQAQFLTAGSPGIAEAYKRKYEIYPTPILNVFPEQSVALKHINSYVDRKDPNRISFYWFSQNVGEDRGLQDILAAFSLLHRPPVEVHIRGTCPPLVKQKLLNVIKNPELKTNVFFHPQINSSDLLHRTEEHDVGLALEFPISINRDICITNKIFQYMNAGLAIIASETQGQSWVMKQVPEAGFCYKPGDVKYLAEKLKELINNPNILKRYQDNSRRAAAEKFNWEIESKKFLGLITQCFEK